MSCERGDIRQSPDGLLVYTDDGCEEILCAPYEDRATEMREMATALANGATSFPTAAGAWRRSRYSSRSSNPPPAQQRCLLTHRAPVPSRA